MRSNVQMLLDELGLKDRLTLVDSNGLQKDCPSVTPRGLEPGAWQVGSRGAGEARDEHASPGNTKCPAAVFQGIEDEDKDEDEDNMQRLAATAQTSAYDNPTWSDAAVITPEQYADAYQDGLKKTTRLLISRGSSPDRAEEAAQAAWVKGWERRSQLREKANVVCWINTIALNMYRSEFRRRDTGELPTDITIAPTTGPATIDLQKLLARCSPGERDLLKKHYGAGFTSSELAGQMKLAPVTVRVRLLRLRHRLLSTTAAGLSAQRRSRLSASAA